MKSVFKTIKLLFSGDTMQRCKLRQILRYHMLSKFSSTETFANHMMLLFYSFGDGKIIVIMFSVIVAKQKSIARSPGGCKHKQNKV